MLTECEPEPSHPRDPDASSFCRVTDQTPSPHLAQHRRSAVRSMEYACVTLLYSIATLIYMAAEYAVCRTMARPSSTEHPRLIAKRCGWIGGALCGSPA